MLAYQVSPSADGEHQTASGQPAMQLYTPISKSDLHRLLIAAALSEGETLIRRCTLSEDIHATARVLQALGRSVTFGEDCITVGGKLELDRHVRCCDCGESGSTLRFLVPVLAALGQSTVFTGKGRLPQRPMEPMLTRLREHGVQIALPTGGETLPLELTGQLQRGDFVFAGDISSQYITGLLFALPLLQDDSRILLSSPLQSKGYVDMTLEVLARFGIRIEAIENGWSISGGQQYRTPGELTAQGDWSNAAFWIAAGVIGQKKLEVAGLSPQSLQGDKAICDVLRQMGANISVGQDSVIACPSQLHGTVIDGSQIPDIIPILSVCAAVAEGETRIINAQRLRLKESDRLRAVHDCLQAIGADIEETADGLIIRGKPTLSGGLVDSFNDHRIAMSMAVASLRCDQPVLIRDPLCVNKSYPDFYQDFIKTGGKVDVIDLGD